MHPLDKKLLRDIRRLWAQVTAISLVMAAGVATVLLAIGSYRSLEETRIAYYERQRFADVFVGVERAPRSVADRIAMLPGVATVETRIVKSALVEIDGMPEPATGLFVSVPDGAMPVLNRPYRKLGVGFRRIKGRGFALDKISTVQQTWSTRGPKSGPLPFFTKTSSRPFRIPLTPATDASAKQTACVPNGQMMPSGEECR